MAQDEGANLDTEQQIISDVAQTGYQQHLLERADREALRSAIGPIVLAGRSKTGDTWVQFNDTATNTGYLSSWPEWFFEIAKAAMLYNKQVWVMSNGDPFGSNLEQVLLI